MKTKGDIIAGQIKIVWKDAAGKYAEGSSGYLSMIVGCLQIRNEQKNLLIILVKQLLLTLRLRALAVCFCVAEAKKITKHSLLPRDRSILKKGFCTAGYSPGFDPKYFELA